MTPKDREFLKTIIENADKRSIKPPYEMNITVFNAIIRKFYEYGTEKSVKEKMHSLVSEGLFEAAGCGFRITQEGESIAKNAYI